MIYQRRRGHQYMVECGFSRPDGMGGRLVKPGLRIKFEPISEGNPTAEYDSTRHAERYVDRLISSGQCEYKDREAKIKEVDGRLQGFIERHQHFKKADGTGLGLIWKKKTMEEMAAELKQSIQAQTDRLREMEAAIQRKDEKELEELTVKPKTDGMAKPVGVIQTATASNTRK